MYNVEILYYDCPVEALATILGRKWVAHMIWGIQDK